MSIKLNENYLNGIIRQPQKDEMFKKAKTAFDKLIRKTGEGNKFLGWVDLPENYIRSEEFSEIKKAAEKIRKTSEVLVVVGIGGSYLGARAAVEFIHSQLYNNKKKSTPDIYFLGNSISTDNLHDVLEICKEKDFSVNVISKSGTTTEPAVAFRMLRALLEEKYSAEGAKERIYVTTDANAQKSKLKALAINKGYRQFVVPDDVGGRYSVLTAVGLLPIAVSGADVDAILQGAIDSRKKYLRFFEDNDCIKYAVLRNILYESGKSCEIMVSYEPAFSMMNEWWKQLYGESEGKNKKGLFPASVIFSTDLHSLGQFIQDGSRTIFETVINIENQKNKIQIPEDKEKIDGMDFVDGMYLDQLNHKAFLGTILAHTDGGTPNIVIDITDRSEYSFGELVYFFELACAVSGYILDVNPFDQPGVEEYKKNMFALLGEGKYAEEKIKLEKRLKDLGTDI